MRLRRANSCLTLALLSAGCVAFAGLAQAADPVAQRRAGPAGAKYIAPRDVFGAPVLEGVWTNLSLTDLQRPNDFKDLAPPLRAVEAFERLQNDAEASDAKDLADAQKAGNPLLPNVGQTQSEYPDRDMKLARVGGQPRSSYLVIPADGKLPYSAAAKALLKARAEAPKFDNPEDRPLNERCVASRAPGPPLANLGYNAHFQIVQTRDSVAILAEMMHDLRVIDLKPIASAMAAAPAWMGHSVGHWEGPTLVVDTQGFNPREFPRGGVVLSKGAKVEERFTRTGPKTILYRFSVSDPTYYTQTWAGEMELGLAPANALYEYACHEGNYALPGVLAGARKAELDARSPG